MAQRRKGVIAEQHNNPMSKQKDPLLGVGVGFKNYITNIVE